MDVTIVAVRSKRVNFHSSVTFDVRDEFDVLLQSTGEGLPKVTVAGDCNHSLLTFIYDLTGLKGTRVLMIPTNSTQISGQLCCIPLSMSDNGCNRLSEDLYFTPLFENVTIPCAALINHFKTWFYNRKLIAGSIPTLFSSNSDERLMRSVTNPAHFFPRTDGGAVGLSESERGVAYDGHTSVGGIASLYASSVVAVAESRMAALDHCDKHVVNNLFTDKLYYANKVDKYIVNKYYGMGAPDYSAIRNSVDYELDPSNKRTPQWCQDYPMHSNAYQGNTKAVRTLMLRGHSVLREDDSLWLPLHYAAWYNHSECVQTLLSEGNCPASLTTGAGSTALHLAARKGSVDVVKVLLEHPNINLNIKDCNGDIPKAICSNPPMSADKRTICNLLLNAAVSHHNTIKVYLVDDSHVALSLDSGDDTTIQQLHEQMLQVLGINEECGNMFAIWICSESLDLQLKREHKALEHLSTWQTRTVLDLCDRADASKEIPRLCWRRDATRSLADDRRLTGVETGRVDADVGAPSAISRSKVGGEHPRSSYSSSNGSTFSFGTASTLALAASTNDNGHAHVDISSPPDPVATRLLFDEAKRNVLSSRYPCSDADAVKLAAILLRLLVGGQSRAAKSFVARKENLADILPSVKTRVKGHRLQVKVLDAHKTYSADSVYKSDTDMHKDYLAICWNLIVYGSAIFSGHIQSRQNIRTFEAVKVLVNDIGIHIVNCNSQKMVHSLNYNKIEWTFISNNSCPVFEIRGKNVISILSRQAQLIHFLAEKFSHMPVYQ